MFMITGVESMRRGKLDGFKSSSSKRTGERTRLAARDRAPRDREALERIVFGEAPKTAREGACAPRIRAN